MSLSDVLLEYAKVDETYNCVEHQAWLILLHPLPYCLLRLRLHRSVDEQPLPRGLFPRNLDCFLIVATCVD